MNATGKAGTTGPVPARTGDLVRQMAEHLDSRLRLRDCDEAGIARALLLMSELHGMSRVARACGMNSDTLRRQLDGKQTLNFDTVLGVSRALGLQLSAEVGAPPPTTVDDGQSPS